MAATMMVHNACQPAEIRPLDLQFFRTVGGGDGDVDHGDNVDGVDEFSVRFLSHNAYQAEH